MLYLPIYEGSIKEEMLRVETSLSTQSKGIVIVCVVDSVYVIVAEWCVIRVIPANMFA